MHKWGETLSLYNIDDTLIFSRTLDKHTQHINIRITELGLKLKPSKCFCPEGSGVFGSHYHITGPSSEPIKGGSGE